MLTTTWEGLSVEKSLKQLSSDDFIVGLSPSLTTSFILNNWLNSILQLIIIIEFIWEKMEEIRKALMTGSGNKLTKKSYKFAVEVEKKRLFN